MDEDVCVFKLISKHHILPVRARKTTKVSELIDAWCNNTNTQKGDVLRLLLGEIVMEDHKTLKEYPTLVKGDEIKVALMLAPETNYY